MGLSTDLTPAPPSEPAGRRRLEALVLPLVAVVAVAAALARLPRLGAPSGMIFDEIYYAKAARQVLAGEPVTEERTHPPLSKLIVAAGIALAGDRAAGWRLPAALAGVALVAVVYALARLLFDDPFAAAAAAMLVALDGLTFVESRIAKPDIFLALFLWSAYAAWWAYLRARRARPDAPGGRALGWAYAAGLAAGCAVATKWTAAPALAVLPAILALAWRRGGLRVGRREGFHLAAVLGAVPLAVYLLTYLPHVMLGHSVGDLLRLHAEMYKFHARLAEGHPYQSPWWSWPLLLRPIWYEYAEAGGGLYHGVVALGNPVIWWAALPALALVGAAAVRTRALPETFVALGFAAAYGQYALIGRALFLYHFLPVVPFLALALAAALARVRAQAGAGPVAAYVLLAAGWLVAFYPVLAARPVPPEHVTRLMWFGTWI